MSKKNIKTTCTIAIGIFLFLQLFDFSLSSTISYAVSAAAILDIFYDRFLWRLNPLDKTPKIFGTYNAVFYSNFNGGTEHNSEFTIKQTLSYISLREECDDGYSESITANLVQNAPNGQWHLYYTYYTHPKNRQLRKHDDPHHGTAILCVKSSDLIEGTYFTNRMDPTGGDLILKKKGGLKDSSVLH